MSSENNPNNNKTKEIEIDFEGKRETVVIRKMGWTEKQRFLEKFITTKVTVDPKTQQENVDVTIKIFERKITALMTCIVKAPFKWGQEKYLDEVDEKILEKIYNEVDKFNELSTDGKKKDSNSEKQLDTEPPTENSGKS